MRAALLLGTLLSVPLAAGAAASDEPQRKALLAQELELAKAHRLYLVVDEKAGALSLKIDGIVLRSFKWQKAEFGQSRMAKHDSPTWPANIFELATEKPEPDRPEVKIVKEDDPNAPPADYMLKEKEVQLAKIPTTYRLEFSPELVVIVRGEPLQMDFASRKRRFWFTLQEGWEGFRQWMKNQPIADRLVIFVTPDDARRIFQVLQPKMKLLIDVPAAG